jgi:chorismate mutase
MQVLPVAMTDRFAEWLDSRRGKCFVAGLCGVETEEQIWHTALEQAQYGITLLQGGIWKPRTRPGSFAGVGSKGLAWLKADINVLWIGARTTTSPLAVDEP